MNLGEIKTRVQRQFGDESGAQITEADIVRWANDGQLDIVRKVEILNQHSETNVEVSDGSYSLPTSFMFMARVTYNGRVLPQVRMRDLDLGSDSTDLADTGDPQSYYTWGNSIFLYPAPNTGGTNNLDLWYVCRPVELVEDSDIPDIPIHMHEDLVRYCLARAKELDDDLDGAERIMGDYETRVGQAVYESTAQPVDSFPAVRCLAGDEG